MERYNIAQFDKDYPNDDACLEWLKNKFYPDGIFCETCSRITKHHKETHRRSYCCDYCGHHVHPTTGTIFEKSTTPLKLWFYAIYQMSSTRCGISAKQIQRETGVTYKTAWRMFKQIRTLLQESIQPMSGKVEVDECYIGGKSHGKRGRGAAKKTPVVGVIERKGEVSAIKVEDVKSSTVYPIIKERVMSESMIYTDEFSIYDNLQKQGYHHKRVHHATRVWVMGDVHTNTIEGFWSALKGGIRGVYHSVSEKYLQNYIDEYAFRYNHRNDVAPMFTTVLQRVIQP